MISFAPKTARPIPRRRRRPVTSCVECRRRKVRCDRRDPCNSCKVLRVCCTYTSQAGQSASAIQVSQYPATSTAPPIVYSNLSNTATVENLHEPDSSVTSVTKEAQDVMQNRLLSLNKSRFFGQSHWTNCGYGFKRTAAYSCVESGTLTETQAAQQQRLEIGALLQRIKLLAKTVKTSRCSRSIPFLNPILSMAEKDFADRVVNLYTLHFESAFRILHVPSFRKEFEQYWIDPSEASCELKFKVQLVLAIGFSIHPANSATSETRSAAHQWCYAAQNWLAGPMEKSRLSIGGLQIQCLLIVARQVLSIGGDLIWVSMGTLVRSAMQMGLHRDPKRFTYMTLLQTEVRRRLWATVLEMNIQASLDSGMPPNISFDDFDTEPPLDVDDEDISSDNGVAKRCSKPGVTDTSLQIFLFKQLRPRLEILRCTNGANTDLTYEQVVALTSDLNKASHDCALQVRKDSAAAVFRQNLAELFIQRFLLTLHRPFANRALINPIFYFSRKICTDTATSLLFPSPNEEFSRMLLVGGGMFKSRIVHVSLALASEILNETEEQRSSSLPWRPSNYQTMLIDALKEARWQLTKRIELGETNVRLYMKLGIVLAEVEFTNQGAPLRQQMAQSAKDSLEMACSTIQARLDDEENTKLQSFDQQYFPPDFDFDEFFQTTNLATNESF